MKKTLLSIVLLSILSCSVKEKKPISQQDLVIVPQKSSQTNSSLPPDNPTTGPARNFRLLVRILDSLGYRSDTVRVAKIRHYHELLEANIKLFDKFPYYKLSNEKSMVLWWNICRRDGAAIDTEIFREAESVWAYFYQKKEEKNTWTDGVIEQWTFADSITAQTAIHKLDKEYPLPYFNTQPYHLVDGKLLFIFHTRADAFSYRQKEFFNAFRVLSKSQGNSIRKSGSFPK